MLDFILCVNEVTDVVVRNAEKRDYAAVEKMLRELSRMHVNGAPEYYPPHEYSYSSEKYEELLADENEILLCAEEDGNTVGFCQLTLSEMSGSVRLKNAHVAFIAVDAEYRRRGIGRAMMQEAERAAAALGAKQLNLQVWEFNSSARRMYEQLGMRPQRTIMIKEIGDGT